MTPLRTATTTTIASFALAAAVTLALLGGVDHLATTGHAGAQAQQTLVQQPAAAPRA
jgi:hypothetical protein